jgi:hypothetical protein
VFVVCPHAEGALARAGQTTKTDRLSYLTLIDGLLLLNPAMVITTG